jgi:hypothetical protein
MRSSNFVFLYYRRVVQNPEQFISTSCHKGNVGLRGDGTLLPLSPTPILGNRREAPLIFESGYIAVPGDMAARAYTICIRGMGRIVQGRDDFRSKNYGRQKIPTT